MAKRIDSALKELFRPEFLNRIDEVITFLPLTRDELKQVMDLMLRDFTKGLSAKDIRVTIDDSAKEFILENGYDEKYGARPLRRAISRFIEDEVAQSYIKGTIGAGDNILVSANDGKIVVQKQS